MIAIHENRLRKILESYQAEIDEHIDKVRESLDDFWTNQSINKKKGSVPFPLTIEQVAYLKLIHRNLDKLVYGSYMNFVHYQRMFNRVYNPVNVSFKPFKDELIKRMGYEGLRDTLYPEIYRELGIKACPYCNSQLAIVAKENGGKLRAKFQVDHIIDKAKNPFLSISFFNFIPVCASCNNKKSTNPINFNFFSNVPTELKDTRMNFRIEPSSLAKFRLNWLEETLEIKFDDYGSGFNDVFAVEGIYNTQKDVAAELILKSIIYNKSYKENLKASFDKLYNQTNINFNRFIVGNYTDPKDIHKRPMSKFTQDIARQIKLI